MTTRTTRRWGRSVGVLAGTLALNLGVSLAPVAPAYAADPLVTADKQNYYKYYNLKAIHDQGITGKGVTIAVLDGAVNTNIPELKGANIQDRMPCIKDSAPENRAHGTTVAQILVSPEFGVAPDATLYTYTLPLHGDASNCTLSGWTGEAVNDTPLLIEQAINDGADIITISSNFDDDSIDLRWAMARALAEGVIVVAAMGNETTENPDDALARWRGICGIGATMPNGTLTEYTNWGNGVLTTALGTVLTRDVSTGRVEEADGTSFATPIIAGFLALGWQHFDEDVSADQILQALAATARGSGGRWNDRTGFGEIAPVAFLASDPTQHPDENPFEDKGNDPVLTSDDIDDYVDGLVDPEDIYNDNEYVYRGIDERVVDSGAYGFPAHLGTSPRYHAQQ